MEPQLVIVLDFGGQYNQLIARRVRECGVYCEVKPYTTPLDEIRAHASHRHHLHRRPEQRLRWRTRPQVDAAIFALGIPVLGICYGCQLMAHTAGRHRSAAASEATAREYGKTETHYDTELRALPRAAGARASPG